MPLLERVYEIEEQSHQAKWWGKIGNKQMSKLVHIVPYSAIYSTSVDGFWVQNGSTNDYNERLEEQRKRNGETENSYGPKIKEIVCECGASKAYGDGIDGSWHSTWCPKFTKPDHWD